MELIQPDRGYATAPEMEAHHEASTSRCQVYRLKRRGGQPAGAGRACTKSGFSLSRLPNPHLAKNVAFGGLDAAKLPFS